MLVAAIFANSMELSSIACHAQHFLTAAPTEPLQNPKSEILLRMHAACIAKVVPVMWRRLDVEELIALCGQTMLRILDMPGLRFRVKGIRAFPEDTILI